MIIKSQNREKRSAKMDTSRTLKFSWEYFMPKPPEIMAGYVRESDPGLAGTNTEESQAKLLREYAKKEGYDYPLENEFREAVSAYTVDYTDRVQLMRMLVAAKQRKFTVLVVSEIRALGRKQAEIFVIYNQLQKYGVRLETVQEKFEDSAMGRLMLSQRAAYAEIEREQIHMRTQRGRRDRLEGGAMNGHPKSAYGYIFVDSPREQKSGYAFNETIIYVDQEGEEWSEYKVALLIFKMLKGSNSFKCVVDRLNEIGVPPPRKPFNNHTAHWEASIIHKMLSNPIYIGEVWGNKYKRVDKKMVEAPKEEWVRLPDAPAMIDKATFEIIQKRITQNKNDALRNNKHPEELGLLRAGHVYCGICKRRMHVNRKKDPRRPDAPMVPEYRCRQNQVKALGEICHHRTQIYVDQLDKIAWEKVIEVLQDPEMVRRAVKAKRKEKKPEIDKASVEATIADFDSQIENLFELAKFAKTEDTIKRLSVTMNDLEKQKRAAQLLLIDVEEDDEERVELEKELVRFENWATQVRPLLTDPSYAPSYEEKRLAVRIIGITAIVYPTQGDWPFRCEVGFTAPEIAEKAHLNNCLTISA
jgi:site-specific DNA recombinase